MDTAVRLTLSFPRGILRITLLITSHYNLFKKILKLEYYVFLNLSAICMCRLRYAKNSGVYAGLSVILDSEIDDYNVTSALFTGFKVFIYKYFHSILK